MGKAKKHTFKTEVSQLLNLMINSLYSNREIFLRELISNGSDALDKLRFSALSNSDLNENDSDLRIEIIPNKEDNTLTIVDSGIGMNEKEVIANIGTIANSGTKTFLENLKIEDAKSSNLIGQFGVGFYSAFMVAEKVELLTRRAGDDKENGVRWISKGDGNFTIQTIDQASKGTSIILTLKEDCKEFLELSTLKNLVHRYSEHITFPVRLPEKEEDLKTLETVNKADALWTQNPKKIKEEDYQSFYKMVATDWDDPLVWTHNHVEGTTEYTSLLFIPKHAQFDLYERERRQGLKLYIKRVFIMEDTEHLLPNYLRFVRGIVDCPDLPLNVSREILQDNRVIKRIRAGIVKKVLDTIESLAKNKPEDFKKLISEFGKVLKEGIVEDADNRQKIAKILRFDSVQHSELSLASYVENMIEEQDTIYYLCAESLSAAKGSPHLDIFKERNIDVLLLSDKIDEWLTSHLTEFEGKTLVSINQANLQLPGEKKEEQEGEDGDKENDAANEAHQGLLDAISESLNDRVKKVQISKRLRQYPACVISESGEMSHHMQQMLKQMGQEMSEIKPILEINPEHNLLQYMSEHTGDDSFKDWANVLLDQALLAEGAQLSEPGLFVTRLNNLLSKLT